MARTRAALHCRSDRVDTSNEAVSTTRVTAKRAGGQDGRDEHTGHEQVEHVARRGRRHIPPPPVRAEAQRQRREAGRDARQGHGVCESPGVEGPHRIRRHQRFGQQPGDADEPQNRPTVREDRPARGPRAKPRDERQGRQQRGRDERDTDAPPDPGARALSCMLDRCGIASASNKASGARHHRSYGRSPGAREHHRAHVEGPEGAAPGIALAWYRRHRRATGSPAPRRPGRHARSGSSRS
jgi:hypothetical protein